MELGVESVVVMQLPQVGFLSLASWRQPRST
jgi:hypothetical protein